LQAQQVKDDVMLEFHVDDGAGDEREDALVELALHVPSGNKAWAGNSSGAGEEGEAGAAATEAPAKV
jgi:hypothetical protein